MPVELPPDVETCETEGCLTLAEDCECSNCDRCEEHCDCGECDGCDEPFDTSEQCERCELCPDCCECHTCPNCHRLGGEEDACPNCRGCERCCECPWCNGCEVRVDELSCGSCDRCPDCGCQCEPEEETVPLTLDFPTTTAPTPTGPPPEPGTREWAMRLPGCTCPGCQARRERGIAPIAENHLPSGVAFRETHIPKFWAGKACEENPSTRFASVELEICGIRDGYAVNEAVKKWQAAVITDGSLPGTGFELPTAPASGDKLVEQLADVCGALAAGEAWVDDQAGMHCHADARDLAGDHGAQWRFLQLYKRVEFGLYSVVTAGRWRSAGGRSGYSNPCGPLWDRRLEEAFPPHMVGPETRPQDDPEWLAKSTPGRKFWYGTSRTDIDQFKRDIRRSKAMARVYEGLNYGSFLHRGTVECRIHHGTADAEKATNWAILWASLVDSAKRMTLEEIGELPYNPPKKAGSDTDSCPQENWDRFCTDSFAALLAVAPTEKIKTWLRGRRRFFIKEAKGVTARKPRAVPDPSRPATGANQPDRGEV